ncbi:MAG: SOS response-associated peptidase [Verrucomicrobiales bacterium]|nr:SOS response-associated peptidase [Verrucomicrobiales bacterium]
MCGRYDLSESGRTLKIGDFELILTTSQPRYNICPTQKAPVVRRGPTGSCTLEELRWGLIPAWAKDTTSAAKCINARSETVAEKPMFRSAFRRRRCLVPADGYYEWQMAKPRKLPWRFTRLDRHPMLFAGLWESWRPPGQTDAPEIETFTILTRAPTPRIAEIHDRMPVILEPEAAAMWLDPSTTEAQLITLCAPSSQELLTMARVTLVGESPPRAPDQGELPL